MKATFGSSWFVALGVSAVVFIGAFARFDPVSPPLPASPVAYKAPVAAEQTEAFPAPSPTPTNSSQSMAEVIRLAESHVDPSVMLAFIQNSGQAYAPTADDILYLSHLGVPENVIAALYPAVPAQPAQPEQAPAPAAAPLAEVAESPLPPDVNSNVFTDALAPYGNWVHLPDYGAAWQPAVETTDPDWRPYVDGGQWINSDSGWYWQSEYAWGWAPFHYGGWVTTPQLGWVWVPGKTWGPAWVSWRSAGFYVGWAPLPPGVSLNVLSQLAFSGHPVTSDYDFGVSLSSYVFVRTSRFLNPNLPAHIVSPGRATTLVASSSVINNYTVINGKIINGGVNRSVVAAARPLGPEVPLVPATPAPELMSPTPSLMASVRLPDLGAPAMQLPPLHGPPPQGAYGRNGFAREPDPALPDHPRFGGPAEPPPRPMVENRSFPPEPSRNAPAASSSASKSTK